MLSAPMAGEAVHKSSESDDVLRHSSGPQRFCQTERHPAAHPQ